MPIEIAGARYNGDVRRSLRILCLLFLLIGCVSIGARDNWYLGSTRRGPCIAIEPYSLYVQYVSRDVRAKADGNGGFNVWIVAAYWETGGGIVLTVRLNWFGLAVVCLLSSFMPSRRKKPSGFPLDSPMPSS